MTTSVDLNADMGEGFGPWPMGNDARLLDIVTSANVACGYHAGDPLVMTRTCAAAKSRGVAIGAHPGFPDLQGFGRRRMHVPKKELAAMIQYQIGGLNAVARAIDARVVHLKLHGALSNMASEDEDLARTCYEAALSVDPELLIYILPGTAMERAVQELGCKWAGEIFADRAYNSDATLVSRGQEGAIIHDAATAAERMVRMVKAGAILPETGDPIPTKIDTICVHGDTPGALEIASHVRSQLEESGVKVMAP